MIRSFVFTIFSSYAAAIKLSAATHTHTQSTTTDPSDLDSWFPAQTMSTLHGIMNGFCSAYEGSSGCWPSSDFFSHNDFKNSDSPYGSQRCTTDKNLPF